MYLRGIFIARFGMALQIFYFSRHETSIDSFSAGKKITTLIPKIYDFPMKKREWTCRKSKRSFLLGVIEGILYRCLHSLSVFLAEILHSCKMHESTTHVNGFVFDFLAKVLRSVFCSKTLRSCTTYIHRVCKPKPISTVRFRWYFYLHRIL